jgi:multiple sugar transport system permease protein
MTRSERFIPYLFLLPAIVLLLIFNLIPAMSTILESLYTNNMSQTGGRAYVALGNFTRIFQDPVFWKSLQVTLIFSLIVNPLQTILAVALAVLANQRVRGISFFRSIFLLPVVVSINVTAVVWGLMLDKNAGVLNGILALFGIPRQPFLISPDQALASIILVVTWKGVPFWMLFLLAGLQGIPQGVLEAAAIDGANRWQTFRRIVLPMLRPVIIFVLVADTIGNFILFVPIYQMTRGGPQLSTNLMMYETFRRGFVYGDLGASSAMLTVVLAIVFVIVFLEFLVFRARR